MNINERIVGLDIGTTKIACFIGERKENGKVRILGFGKTESVGVQSGVVLNVLETARSIERAVDAASEMAKCSVREVYVGVAGQHIKNLSNTGSIMVPDDHSLIEESDVQQLIDDQYRIMLAPGEEIIHVFPQSYSVDNEELSPTINPIGVAGRCLKANFHIVTGNADNVRKIHDAVRRAGLEIKGVILEPIASSLAVLDDRDKEAGVALVDIGGGTTDIAIFKGGVIRHTSVIPLAGDAITQDIHRGCQILRPQAESLKTKFGSCVPTMVNQDDIVSIPSIRNLPAREISVRLLAEIIKGRTEQILEQVQYEIEESGYGRQLGAGIALTGGGSRLQNIKDFSEFTIGIDTRIGIPDEHLDQQGGVAIGDLSHPMYATGIGLVIYGLLESEKNASLGSRQEEEEIEIEEEEEQENTTPVDSVEEQSQEREKETSSRKKSKHSWFESMTKWLEEKFTDPDLGE